MKREEEEDEIINKQTTRLQTADIISLLDRQLCLGWLLTVVFPWRCVAGTIQDMNIIFG